MWNIWVVYIRWYERNEEGVWKISWCYESDRCIRVYKLGTNIRNLNDIGLLPTTTVTNWVKTATAGLSIQPSGSLAVMIDEDEAEVQRLRNFGKDSVLSEMGE